MYIKKTYVFDKDGIIGYACGYIPDGKIFEEREVLYAENGFELYKDDENVGSAVWLKDTVQEDYTEKEIKDAN